MMHKLYEIWKVAGSKWALKIKGDIIYRSTKAACEAYKWACLRP